MVCRARPSVFRLVVLAVSLSFWLVLVPAVSYALATLAYAYQRNWPLVIMYSGYSWAACGALWLDRLMAK